jgi:hypothetical protein
MREYNEYMARVAICEQRAKDARTESEKQSWLVMADSWRETVRLQERKPNDRVERFSAQPKVKTVGFPGLGQSAPGYHDCDADHSVPHALLLCSSHCPSPAVHLQW